MKRITATTLLLTTLLFVGYAGNLSAFDITYNGYNDGAYLDIDQNTGLVNGFLTGSIEGDVMGFLGEVQNQGMSIVLTYTEGSVYEGLTTVLRTDGTWSHYFHDGTQMLELNTGDWAEGMPVVQYGENLTSSLDIVDLDEADLAARTIIKKDPVGTESVADPGNSDSAVRVIIKKHPKGTESVAARTIIKKDPVGTESVAEPGNSDSAVRVIIKKHPKGTESVVNPGSSDTASRVIKEDPAGVK